MKQQNKNIRKPQSAPVQNSAEKANSRYIFACVAGILYVMPGLMCLAFGILSDGFSTAFLTAILTAVFGLPVAFTGLYCYKQRRGRPLVLALSAVQLILHIVSASLITTWYIILAPAFILTLVLVVYSRVIENH